MNTTNKVKKILKEKKVKLLGTGVDGIRNAEDRQAFKDMMETLEYEKKY